jgi:hypothetical protein
MSSLPKKFVVDTNVPKTANLAINPEEIPDDLTSCVWACIEAIDHIVKKGGLVIDSGDEIFTEYRKQLSMRGRPGIGDHFMKWVHDNRWGFPDEDRVVLTKNNNSYYEFPEHVGLLNIDPSDKKFIAVSNAHNDKPPILQATDSKWWGWQKILAGIGIKVQFLCLDYVRTKYDEKMG